MTDDPVLRQFGILFDLPGQVVENLRVRFPDIEFVTSSAGDNLSCLETSEAILAWRLQESDVDQAPALRWVQWIGAGVESAPLTALERRGIILTNNSGVHATNIAEHVLSMMLAFTRNLPALFAAQARREWSHATSRDGIGELSGSHLLIVGAGRIGSALADRAEALGQHVTLVGRLPRSGRRPVHGIDELDDLLPHADHVAICLPLTPQTHGLFSADRLQRMKSGGRIYNIGRGSIIDTEALVAALNQGTIGGAGLDVTDPEPLPEDHPLWSAPNTIITAHTSGSTPRYWDRAYDILCDNIERFRTGQPLRNVVRYDLGY